ncbi:flagellar assembly protein FliH [Shewanella sedimentimangrovi]|uniref:Flagellar assembly protein FliH n=1 Tax=Shewanella sedimentimangrovi TaxID=2814293 RepID=A0ABX7QYZ5_9GAMM|nr:flagellar assembly protein FliH [Shewanella sedimentimangrovi]QSX36075.1 flagellar assembly protein FliH [Shewanella sedimentimangrovi]
MTYSKPAKHLLRPESDKDFSHWQLPDVTEVQQSVESNLLGRKPGVYQPAPAEEVVAPPTMAEIEAIREAAEQEGFTAGQEQGYGEGLEKGRLTGLEQGHKEGFVQGHEQGLAEGLAQAGHLVERFEALMAQFAAPLSHLDKEIELSLVELAMTLARQVLLHELKTHPEQVLAALRKGVECLPIKEQRINLRLNPDDVELLSGLYSQAQLERQKWEIEADPTLARGDCIIESQRSSVDLRIEQRMAAVFEGLEQQTGILKQQLANHEQHLEQAEQTLAAAEEDQAGVQTSEPGDDDVSSQPTPAP